MTQRFHRDKAISADDERELLRRARELAALELEGMKRELAERINAVKERETELEALLAASRQGTDTGPADEARLPPPVEGSDLEHLERRLAELREAERQFLRTQEELAARSDALAARERLVADRERQEASAGGASRVSPSRTPSFEPQASPPVQGQSFADGLESLRRRGTRRLQP